MVFTPYPDGNDKHENPSIRASNDGMRWIIPENMPDPIIPQPEKNDFHHSDPCIVIIDGILHLFYRSTDKIRKTSTISWAQTTNLIDWTDSKVVYSGKWVLSPSVVFAQDCWNMWFVDMISESNSQIMITQGSDPENFGEAYRCEVSGNEYSPWHIEVKKNNSKFYAILNCFPGEFVVNRQVLFIANSINGINWTIGTEPIAKPSLVGWDNKLLYKASFLLSNDRLRIWYSACSWGGKWGIGYLEGTLAKVQRVSNGSSSTLLVVRKLFQDVGGLMKFCIKRYLPNSIIAFIQKLR